MDIVKIYLISFAAICCPRGCYTGISGVCLTGWSNHFQRIPIKATHTHPCSRACGQRPRGASSFGGTPMASISSHLLPLIQLVADWHQPFKSENPKMGNLKKMIKWQTWRSPGSDEPPARHGHPAHRTGERRPIQQRPRPNDSARP